ncbi:TIGR03032 family protein [Sphingomonas jatrophae]|uniref:TIGR03032 family protein n=1 Tax=Sphingomonas jatrophae TaxID=1166337 RepID=A0A1I6MDI4_9SPHN|nr:TIGR03032 family protein [Sphingomonas jatrophae]SFS13652.1 TIGR03032 family protein [Sphingomonas jatrophae]
MSNTPPPPPSGTSISVSRGFAGWLDSQRVSLAFTSYQTGQLFLVGLLPTGSVSFNQQNFTRAMGICRDGDRLWLGSLFQLWRLENMLRSGEQANGSFDAVFVPREGRTTGDIDIHEIGVLADGQPIFVNTKHSCLATLDPVHSFRPYWRPPFISKLAAEDRCHLNGLAMEDGRPAYVTAVSQSDVLNGWRARRDKGGVIVDVASGEIVTDQLSMPHSPRIANGKLYALDSGRGQLISVNRESGAKEDIAFCPGFLRGLSIHNGFAIVTASKPRDGSFKELALEQEIARRDGEPWCGVFVIDLRTGDLAEWIRLEGDIAELFDVAVLPNVACPMSLGVETVEIQQTISIGKGDIC